MKNSHKDTKTQRFLFDFVILCAFEALCENKFRIAGEATIWLRYYKENFDSAIEYMSPAAVSPGRGSVKPFWEDIHGR